MIARSYIIFSLFIRVFCISILCQSVCAQDKKIEFEHISLREGLSQSHVYCTIKDKQGFIWFGTQDGLNRFNGQSIKIFKKDLEDSETLSDNYITSLSQDRLGRIWVGTENGLNLFEPNYKRFIRILKDDSLVQGLLDHQILELIYDKEDQLWVGTSKGLYKLAIKRKYDRFVFDTFPEFHDNRIISMHLNQQGDLWVGTEIGLYILRKGQQKFRLVRTFPGLVQCIFEDQQQNLWIGTNKKLYQKARQKNAFKVVALIPDKLADTQNFSINSIEESDSQELWIGTDVGLFVKDRKEKITHYYKKAGFIGSLSSDRVHDVYKDDQGLIWVGTYIGGMNKFNPSWNRFLHYSLDNSKISSNNIKSFCQDSIYLWIATYAGGLNRLNLNTNEVDIFKNNSRAGDLGDNDVQVVYLDSKKRLWVGSRNAGLFLLNPDQNTFRSFPFTKDALDPENKKSLLSPYVRDIYEDNEGYIWICTWGGGLSRLDFKETSYQFTHYIHQANDINSLPVNTIYTIIQDRYDDFWIGTRGGGLCKLDSKSNQFSIFQNEEGNSKSLSNDKAISIYEDKAGNIWVGTYGGGINLFNPRDSSFRHFGEKEGLPNDVAYGILEDHKAGLWISTNKGISRLSLDANGVPKFYNFDALDGLQSNEFNGGAFFQNEEGHMFFGGINGFNTFVPEEIRPSQKPPPVIITDLLVFNEPVRINEGDCPILKKDIGVSSEISLDYNQWVFSLEFVALSYAQSNKTRYAYRLQGFKKGEWNYTRDRRRVTYTNLDPGTYFFEVKAAHHNGEWSKVHCLKIIIRPPFWRTWWFQTLAVLLGISLVYLVIRYRIRRIQNRKEELEKEVQLQTSQIQQQKEELESTLDNLKSTQTQLLQADKMASLGQLTAGIAHEINNPINFVYAGIGSLQVNTQEIKEVIDKFEEINEQNVAAKLQEVEDLKKEVEFEELLEELDELIVSIKRGAERTTEIVKGLRTFSRLDEDQLKEADLHENIDATLSILRNQFKNRIEIIKNYQSDLPLLDCYPGKLNQVFMNVLTNGIQAIKEKGSISISTQLMETYSGNNGPENPGPWVRIGIKDDGVGMSEEVKRRVFEPFFTTKDVGKGTGLGMSITHSIIEKHQGQIEVNSAPGNGTEFLIFLPLRQTNTSGN